MRDRGRRQAPRARQPADRPRDGDDRDLEGCLSIPGYVAYVTRREKVWVVAQNRFGRKIKVAGTGLLARALQHELDHLDGKLYIDYLDSMDELIPVGQARTTTRTTRRSARRTARWRESHRGQPRGSGVPGPRLLRLRFVRVPSLESPSPCRSSGRRRRRRARPAGGRGAADADAGRGGRAGHGPAGARPGASVRPRRSPTSGARARSGRARRLRPDRAARLLDVPRRGT